MFSGGINRLKPWNGLIWHQKLDQLHIGHAKLFNYVRMEDLISIQNIFHIWLHSFLWSSHSQIYSK